MYSSNVHSNADCEILVMGGGPAGSTAATLLARQGRKVILLEKSCEFRRAIGTSPPHADRTEHRYRMAQARLQFTGGTTPLDSL